MNRGSNPPHEAPRPSPEADMLLEPLSVRVAMAVRLTGISRSRIYELIQSGDLPVKKVGRSTLIPFADLKRLAGAANRE